MHLLPLHHNNSFAVKEQFLCVLSRPQSERFGPQPEPGSLPTQSPRVAPPIAKDVVCFAATHQRPTTAEVDRGSTSSGQGGTWPRTGVSPPSPGAPTLIPLWCRQAAWASPLCPEAAGRMHPRRPGCPNRNQEKLFAKQKRAPHHTRAVWRPIALGSASTHGFYFSILIFQGSITPMSGPRYQFLTYSLLVKYEAASPQVRVT